MYYECPKFILIHVFTELFQKDFSLSIRDVPSYVCVCWGGGVVGGGGGGGRGGYTEITIKWSSNF